MNVAEPAREREDERSSIVAPRYPIAGGAAHARRERLIADCRLRFARDGAVLLPGFVRPAALAAMTSEAVDAIAHAHFCRGHHNAYLASGEDSAWPSGHPRNRGLRTDVGSIPGDRLPNGALWALYRWPALTDFIGAVVGETSFHRSADPLGALSVNVFEAGDGHGWHFDESAFSVTLMLQAPREGGAFEYVRDLRSAADPSFDRVGAVLDGDRADVEVLDLTPGTLSIFAGQRTLHRVCTVGGCDPRLVAVLCYDARPGAVNSPVVRRLFWGREG